MILQIDNTRVMGTDRVEGGFAHIFPQIRQTARSDGQHERKSAAHSRPRVWNSRDGLTRNRGGAIETRPSVSLCEESTAGEAHIPAQQPQAPEQARLPGANGDSR